MNNFAVLDIAYTHYVNGLYICIKTDTPCHLTCYYTDEKPGRHKTSRRERGIDLPWGAYFCFVAWKEVEQMEAGDTIYHRFNIYPWGPLHTKWLAFRGTISSELSPSVSPVFEHWHPGGLPMSVKLAVYWPGDLCSNRLDGTGPACPDHWKSVTSLPGYDPGWYLSGQTINRWWGYDSYKVERGDLGKIESLTHWMKVKRHGGYAYVGVCRHLLRLGGVSKYRTIPSTNTFWQWKSQAYPLNPFNGQQWTQADLDALQPGLGLRKTTSVGWTAVGFCDELYIIVERGINCPDD